jgi:hypothetical protein
MLVISMTKHVAPPPRRRFTATGFETATVARHAGDAVVPFCVHLTRDDLYKEKCSLLRDARFTSTLFVPYGGYRQTRIKEDVSLLSQA